MLNTLPFFSLLSSDELAHILPGVQRRSYSARALIQRSGCPSDGLYVITSGSARVFVDNGEGREFVVSILSENDFFGESGLLEDEPSHVSVETEQACTLLHVPRARLLWCVQRNASVAFFMLRTALARLNEAHCKLEALALTTVYGRVARLLLDTAHDANGRKHVDLGTEQIAMRVGASREMVSRVLRDMIDNRLVERNRRKLILIDPVSIAERNGTMSPAVRDPRNRDARRVARPIEASGSVALTQTRRAAR